MKVKIRKYHPWLNTLKAEEFLEKKLGFSELWAERVCIPLTWMCLTYNKLYPIVMPKRVKVKIDYWDTWGMDSTLAPIVLPMLIQLKATKQGAPIVDCEDVPKEMRWSKKEQDQYKKNGETPENFFDRWDWVMDQMIYSFDYLANERESEIRNEHIIIDHEKLVKDFGRSVNTMEEIFELCDKNDIDWITGSGRDYYTYDWDKIKEHEAKIDNGFRLFGKYFRALWD